MDSTLRSILNDQGPMKPMTRGGRVRRAFSRIGASLVAVLCVGVVLPASAVDAQAQTQAASTTTSGLHDGPWLGTWQRRGTGPAWILKMWKEGDGIRYTINVARPGGTPTHMEAWVRFDGEPYPEKGNASADHNVFERLDDHTLRLTDVKNGKKTIQFTITYSDDGKVRTSVSSRFDDKGEPVKNAEGELVTSTGVWDRIG